ncbi:hypothetical protein GCM10009850_083010 [Nonomuraea monospora]|uniref:Uncharacterized protein n=1 Tax=Nonomuraea monospora TaxID=568818 RepID=A0ABN3CTQ4_9ACTN
MWDVAMGRSLRVLGDDGTRVDVVAATPDGALRVWELDWELSVAGLV